ncbi:MAG: hypothetical protein QXJ96_01390 [Candidatus Aenigmatarchaeota archaeon]|nr:hypothetical protein [Candidatus Aenigmarchaeota archaeon]
MAEIFEEVLNEELIQKNVNDSEKAFLNILELAEIFGELKERERKIYTSAKGEIITASFEVKKSFDSISFLNFYFEIIVEENFIKIYIKSSLNSALEQSEFLFNEFYINKYYPKLLEKSKKISKEFIEKIKQIIS